MTLSLAQVAVSIGDSMAGITRIDTLEDRLRITTHCLYPSNSLVRVSVRLSGNSAIVSDDRAALNEAQSAGLDIRISDRSIKHLVTPYGATVSNGMVFATVAVEAVTITAIFVANASRALADWLFLHTRIKQPRDFRALLTQSLQRRFDSDTSETIFHRDVEIAGVHTKHKFANLIALPKGRRIIIDPVVPDAASINSRIVAHLDVRNLGDESIIQRLVYDDADEWNNDKLNLLSVGATAVAFSRSGEVWDRLAAHA